MAIAVPWSLAGLWLFSPRASSRNAQSRTTAARVACHGVQSARISDYSPAQTTTTHATARLQYAAATLRKLPWKQNDDSTVALAARDPASCHAFRLQHDDSAWRPGTACRHQARAPRDRVRLGRDAPRFDQRSRYTASRRARAARH